MLHNWASSGNDMRKSKISKELASHIQRNVEVANLCLAPDRQGSFSEFERGLLSSTVSFDYNLDLADAALGGDADALLRLLKSEQIISIMTGISQTHHKHSQRLSAENARNKRAVTIEEMALIDAIIAEHGNKKCERTSKVAYSILKLVNARLTKQKLPPVKVDVIRRRLAKFPLSDREQ